MHEDERGVAVVEFALLMPLLLLILTGVIQFGLAFSQYQVFQGAAREGARCAAVQAGGYSTCDVTTVVTDAASPYTLSETPEIVGACTYATRGQEVKVQWDQQIDMSILAFVPAAPDTITAHISGTFRCE
jgi:Flp pilus assembly protein TadG